MDKELQRKINKSLQRRGWVMRQDWCQLPYGWQSVWTIGHDSFVAMWDDDAEECNIYKLVDIKYNFD